MKKKINIVLILAVVGLWGTVGYKTITQYLFPKKNVANLSSTTKDNFNPNFINKDTFHLEIISRDPFLNNQTQNKSLISRPSSSGSLHKNVNPIIKRVEIKNWPIITYYGYIKSKENMEELFLIKIEKTLYKLRKDVPIEGITLKQVYNDSIALYFKNERRFFRINK